MRRNISKKKGCQCSECQSLCQHEPGWFLPEEIDSAAAYCKISREEFLSRQCECHRVAGMIVGYSPIFLKKVKSCIFFKKGLCQIHEVKPYECRKVYGCESPRLHKRIRELIEKRYLKESA